MAHSRRRHLHGQELPRSQGIETTQRYLHLVPGHAEHVVPAAQNAEREEIEQLVRNTSGRHLGDTTWADEESHVGESVLTH